MISTASLKDTDPQIAELVRKETQRKEFSLELIPSENCVSEAVLEVTGSILTDKYCEGYPGRRYYGGCDNYDDIERLARDRAKEMFGAKRANVQPHCGSSANMAVIFGLLQPGDTILGPRLDHGGHLTHGSEVNFSGKYFNAIGYGVNGDSHRYEIDEIRSLAKKHNPKLIISGATAYSRQFDWEGFRKVADEVGAILMSDVAHYAGLIVGGAYDNPFPYADVVTSTTHKTLRGPRGGIILTNNKDYAKAINKMIFPGIQGGPLMHQVAAKAVAFKEALTDDFKVYAKQVVANAKKLAAELQERGVDILTGGTDSHLMVIDLRSKKANGAEVEEALGKVGITVNKNTVPNDPEPPKITSGIRLGTPAITSRGFSEDDMVTVADCIAKAIEKKDNDAELKAVRDEIVALCKRRPLFPHRLEG